MPYIEQRRRRELDEIQRAATWHDSHPQTAGELNYVITQAVLRYMGRAHEAPQHAPAGYAELNEVIGVLECVKQELYRRVAAPYEDRKCAENGDVYR